MRKKYENPHTGKPESLRERKSRLKKEAKIAKNELKNRVPVSVEEEPEEEIIEEFEPEEAESEEVEPEDVEPEIEDVEPEEVEAVIEDAIIESFEPEVEPEEVEPFQPEPEKVIDLTSTDREPTGKMISIRIWSNSNGTRRLNDPDIKFLSNGLSHGS